MSTEAYVSQPVNAASHKEASYFDGGLFQYIGWFASNSVHIWYLLSLVYYYDFKLESTAYCY